jgi:RimJ/RimL family protein N-acetyltransferase
MVHPYWPLFDLLVRTPRLELRYPDDGLLVEVARVAAKGIHDPALMPFSNAWTRAGSPDLERSTLKYFWALRSAWSPDRWTFPGAVVVDGRAVGLQSLEGEAFPVTGAVTTGSWLGREFQGQGIGKEMRAAILHLAFEGLGARVAYSGAYEDNPASLKVSRALGYSENGDQINSREGKPAREIRLKLTREAWEERRRQDIEVVGFGPCREWFGVT